MNMKTKMITIGILTMIAVCTTMATAIDIPNVEMTPDTLNLNKGGKYINVCINESDLGDIDPMDLYLTDELNNNGTEENNVSVIKVSYNNEIYDYTIKFPKEVVIKEWLAGTEESVINLYVKYVNDTNDLLFIGTDTFNVTVNNKPKK